MQNKTLKPLTDFERMLLAALGESVQEHQANMQKRLLGQKVVKKLDTKPSVRKLNQEFEKQRYAARYEHIATVVKRMQSARRKLPTNLDEAMELGWKIEAYVFFQQHILCRTCEYTEKSLDSTKMFAKLSSPRPYEAVLYIPTGGLPVNGKPRLVEVKRIEISHCPYCWGIKPPKEVPHA